MLYSKRSEKKKKNWVNVRYKKYFLLRFQKMRKMRVRIIYIFRDYFSEAYREMQAKEIK